VIIYDKEATRIISIFVGIHSRTQKLNYVKLILKNKKKWSGKK